MNRLNSKNVIRITAILISVLLLCGCWNRRELDTLAIVLGIGVDKGDSPGQVTVTTQIEKSMPASGGSMGGGGDKPPYLNITNTGTDMFSIFRDYNSEVSRKMYFPHNQICIFSEDLAKEGVSKYIDFFLRDPETRVTVKFFVAKGKTSDVLEVEPRLEPSPAVDIASILESQQNTSEAPNINLFDFLTSLVSPTTSSVAPLLSIEKDGDEDKIVVAGCGVFKKDKLVGEFNGTETRGLLWVLGQVKSGIINFAVDDGSVELEIIKATSKVKPVILPDGTPLIKIEITESGNLGSQSGMINEASLASITLLEKRKSEFIKAEIEHTLLKAQEMGTDVFGFGDKFGQHYPKQWKTMEPDWDTLFKTLQVEITVKSSIHAIGKLALPPYSKMKSQS